MSVTDSVEFVFGGDSVDIPEGTYKAVLQSLTVKHSQKNDNDFYAWDFKLANGSVVGGSSSMNTGSRSKAGKWGRALLGREAKQGEKADLRGKPCLVKVEINDDGWPKVTDVMAPMTEMKLDTVPDPTGPEENLDELPF